MGSEVLLCNPLAIARDPVEQRLMEPYFPLGLLYLAAVLRQADFGVSIFDGAFTRDFGAFERALAEREPRVVGLSVLNTTRSSAREHAARARASGALVVLGGPDPTAQPERYFSDPAWQGLVDVVALGEAEETIVELCHALLRDGRAANPSDLGHVRGLALLDSQGSLVRTVPRPFIADLDRLPEPARDLVDLDPYQDAWRARRGYSSLSLLTARGCPFHCAWCAKPVFGRRFRQRSPARVAAEMRHLRDAYHPDQLRIVDDTLPINRRWLAQWRDEVVRQDAAIPFECLSRVDLVDEGVLRDLKAAGCRKISFGAESGSQKVLDAMGKGISVEQTIAAADLMKKLGLETYFFVMVGYPGEELEDIQATLRLLERTLPDEFSSTIAYPLPGTEFYEQVRDRLLQDRDWKYSAENTLLFQRDRYSTRFYRWVQRWFQKEVALARLRARGRAVSPAGLRLAAEAAVSHLAVSALATWARSATPFVPARSA
ncbi:MAG: B12-binding domain-containing radical SAM protein [Chloroflexi bacterium]|nr:B12-binding domain-containing radical SAM protein [Chloroflexota bacterium]